MTHRRTRISPTVLADLARRVHSDQPKNHLQNAIAYVLFVLWSVWVCVVPIVLLLLFFKVNFTVQWVFVGACLLAVSALTIGAGFLIAGLLPQKDRKRQRQALLFGLGIIFATLCASILGFLETHDQSSAWLVVSASVLLAIGGIGVSLYLFMSEQQPLFFRLLWLTSLVCFSISVVVVTLLVQADYLMLPFSVVAGLNKIQTVLQPFAWGSYVLVLLLKALSTKMHLKKPH
jgi:hypothetical protein